MRDRLLHSLSNLVWFHPWRIVGVGAMLAIVCAACAATSLRLNANLDDLIARDRPFMSDYRRFLEEFGDLEYIIVAIDASKDRAAARRAVDALLPRLRAIEGAPTVHGTIEPEEQLRVATRAMTDEELRDLALASAAIAPLLTADARLIAVEANALLERLIAGGATMPAERQERTAATAMLLLESIAASQHSEAGNPGLASPPQRQYLASDTGRLLFIHILPAKDYATLSVIEEPLRRIRAAIDETRREFPAVEIGLTGKPVMQYDEMATSNSDMTRASIAAFVLCAILFMVMIGGVRRPLLAMLAFGMAAAWTYGFATLAVGQLNLLSLVFMLVLVGVGLDYGVHVINRYQEFLARGEGVQDSIRGAVRTAVRGNVTGALTSSVVFFMAFFTTFQGLRELGLIAGGGLILCLIAMSIVLPALLAIVDRRRRVIEQPRIAVGMIEKSTKRLGIVDDWLVLHARGILVAAAILTAGLGSMALAGPGEGGRFEYNLLNLQAEGLASIEWERRILNDSAAESWFAAAVARDQAEALQFIERARGKPSIGRVRSVFDVVQPDSPERDAWRATLHPDGAGIARADDMATLNDVLSQAIANLRLIAHGASSREPEEARAMVALHERLQAIDANDVGARAAIDAALRTSADSLRIMLTGDRLPLRDALPAAVRDSFISPAGSYMVMLHPAEDVWDYESMSRFIADLRAVDANVTGVPITHYESLGEMRRAFVTMSLLAVVAIVLLLAIDFRSVRDVLLALTPLVVGMIWTIGAMRILGVSFNLANFFAAPMLIGLGVDSAVHILHRFHETRRSDGGERLRFGHTRRAVILTGLTTIIGFGALLLAHHRGLRSLGLVMAIGSTACMLSSIFILPSLLAWCEMRRDARGSPSSKRSPATM